MYPLKLFGITAHYNNLVLRERFLLLLSVSSVIYLLWFFLLEANITEEINLLKIDNSYLENKIKNQEAELGVFLKDKPELDKNFSSLLVVNAKVDEQLYASFGDGEGTLLAIVDDFLKEAKNIVVDEVVFLPKVLIKELSPVADAKQLFDIASIKQSLDKKSIDAVDNSYNYGIRNEYQARGIYRFSVSLTLSGLDLGIIKSLKKMELNDVVFFDSIVVKKIGSQINRQSDSQINVIFYVLGIG